jgi:putative transposase
VSYKLVEDLQKKACPKVAVSQSCRVLEVSRSGYYANVAVHKQRLAEPVVCADSVHLKAAFAASHKAYGSRRLRIAMAERGLAMGRHRVRTLMRLNGLRPVWRRKFVHTTDSKHSLAVSPNVLDRQFEQALPNQVWVADITYIRTRSGWLYLAAVLDLHSRKVVGWAMASAMPASLVCTALQMAIVQRNPAPGLIIHSDRGTQYASSCRIPADTHRYHYVRAQVRVHRYVDGALALLHDPRKLAAYDACGILIKERKDQLLAA